MLDLPTLKQLFQKGIEHAKKKYSSLFFSRDDKLCDYQVTLANKTTDINSFMNALWLSNTTLANAYNQPKSVCNGCELSHTDVQFGIGNIEWYFYYGIAGNIGFNLNFVKMEIAPPEVVDEMGYEKSETVRWIVLGGYGEIGGTAWYSIQPEWIYMKYDRPTVSPPYNPSNNTPYSTFNLMGQGNTISANLLVENGLLYTIILSYTDTTGAKRNLSIELQANTQPSANFPGACECGYSLGSFYYSFPDMGMKLSIDQGKTVMNGNGWMDHQLIKAGVPNNMYVQALQTLSIMLGNNKSTGWLWFAIQDYESDTQYMLTHLFNNKFYYDDIKLNTNINMDIINVYKRGVPYFKPQGVIIDGLIINSSDTRVEMVENNVVGPFGLHLPSKYKITFPGGKKVVFKIATAPNIYPVAHAPYETPAFLYDETETKQIGIGLIEANWYFTNDQLASRLLLQAGGNPTDLSQYNLVLNGIIRPQNVFQKFLAIIVVLFPVWFILLAVYFIYYKRDNRQPRAILFVILFLFFILALY